MCKRLLVLVALLLLVGNSAFGEAVGVFEDAKDIGGPKAIGSTVVHGSRTLNGLDTLVEEYLITGGGDDIWNAWDRFHFAYRTVTGDIRVSSSFDFVVGNNDWTKFGVMLRDMGADGDAVSYQEVTRKGGGTLMDGVFFQGRPSQGAGATGWGDLWQAGFKKVGVQRVNVGGLPFVEGLVDFGNGWELQGTPQLAWNLPDQIGAGVVLTSHDNNWAAQVIAYDVQYDDSPEAFTKASDFPTITADLAIDQCSQVPGFMVHVAQPLVSDGWGWAAAAELLDTGTYLGLPPVPGTDVTVNVPVVNFRDTGNGAFGNDMSFPGIDPFEQPANDPAAGDDDNNYGAEVDACIYLTAGLHIIGANSDDGTIVEIGGVEIGRSEEWKGASNRDFVFNVEADGYYSLHALWMEGGGGSSLELHEVLSDGTRILLGDTAAGGSPVYVPEPATIALLGLGSLALIRRRKGA